MNVPRVKALILPFLLAGLLASCDAPPPESGARTHDTALWTPVGLQVGEVPRAALEALDLGHGVMVTRVRAPADRSRILPGDVIVSVNQTRISTPEEFSKAIGEHPAGTISVLVRRLDADLYFALQPEGKAGAQPPAPLRPATGTPLRT